jgi:hypothetical protein
MKKTLVILLILAVAGGVFAQDITFSGEVKTGLQFALDDDGAVKLWHDDAGAAEFGLAGAFTEDNYGLNFKLSASYNGQNAFVKESYAYLWAEFLNAKLKLTGGWIDGAVWGSGGPTDVSYDAVKGVRFEIKPLDGLDVGFAFGAQPNDGDGADGFDPTNTTNGSETFYATLKNFFLEPVIGVKYSNDIFGSVTVAVAVDNEDFNYEPGTWPNVTNTGTGTPDPANTNRTDTSLLFGLDFSKLVTGLTAIVDGQLTTLTGDEIGWALGEKVGYQINDAFSATLVIKEAKAAIGGDATAVPPVEPIDTIRLDITPSASYVWDKFTFGLEVSAYSWLESFGDYLSIYAKPSVTYKLGDHAEIAGWYKGIFEVGDTPIEGKSNTIQINFGWTF